MVDAGSIYSEVRVKLDRLKADIGAVEKEFDKFGVTNKQQTTKVEDGWTKSFNAVNLAGVAAFAAIGIAVKKVAADFGEFDDAMAQVRAVTEGTESDMASLEAAALNLGSTTQYSAKQAADALYQLSIQGKGAAESIELLDQAQLLAGATNSDLVESTKLLVKTMNQFGIETQDAGRIVNALAATKIEIATFGEVLSSIGPVAKGMGLQFEEVIAIVRLLGKTGVEGGQATMALKTILGDLSDDTSPLVTKMKALGLSFESLNPKTHSLAQIVGELQKAGLGASEMMALFGNRAGPVMTALLSQGQSAIEAYTESITGTSAATEMYEKRNDSLNDKLAGLANATQVAGMSIMKEFNPALKAIVDVAAKVMEFIGKLPGPLKIFIGIAAVGIPTIIGLGTAFKMLSAAVTGSAGIISIVVAGIAGAVALASALPHLIDPTTRAQDRAIEAEKELSGATEELSKSLDALDAVQKKIKKSTKDMTEEQKKALEIEQQRLSADVAGKLANQLTAVSKWQKQVATDTKLLSQYERAYAIDYEQARRTAAMRYKDQIQIDNAAFKATELKRQGIDAVRKSIDSQNKSIDDTVMVLAESVKMEKISIAQIEALDPAIADLVRTRIKQITVDKEWVRVNAEAVNTQVTDLGRLKAKVNEISKLRTKNAEEEKLKQEAIAALNERIADITTEGKKKEKASLDLINTTLDEQKSTLDKLKESLVAVEAVRGLTGKNEADRQKAILALKEKIKEEEKKEADAKTKATAANDDYNQRLEEIGKTELELIELERKRALAAAGGSAEAVEAINKYYDALRDDAAQKQARESFKETFETITGYATDAFGAIGGLVAALAEARVDELDAQMQRELEAAGVAEKTAVETAQAELDAAREAGDEAIILEKENALKKAKIEEEYERKKAKLQYEAAMVQWGFTLAQTIAEAAAAVIKVFPNIPLMIAAGVVGGVSVAGVIASKPTKPKFETGGIVLGPPGRDQVDARLTAGEMVLTAAQQAELWKMLSGRSGSGSSSTRVSITLPVYLDGRKVAENSAEYYNGNVVVLR